MYNFEKPKWRSEVLKNLKVLSSFSNRSYVESIDVSIQLNITKKIQTNLLKNKVKLPHLEDDLFYKSNKHGIINVSVGKFNLNFDQITDNINILFEDMTKNLNSSIKGKLVKKAFISTTNGPSIEIKF